MHLFLVFPFLLCKLCRLEVIIDRSYQPPRRSENFDTTIYKYSPCGASVRFRRSSGLSTNFSPRPGTQKKSRKAGKQRRIFRLEKRLQGQGVRSSGALSSSGYNVTEGGERDRQKRELRGKHKPGTKGPLQFVYHV